MRRLVGVVLVTAGVLLLGWLVVSPVLGSWQTARAQEQLSTQVPSAPPGATSPDTSGRAAGRRAAVPVMSAVATGEALAHLRVPRFGDAWQWTVVEGTGEDQLASGPGHYTGTPWPGGRGNSAIAAHRAGHGDPFLDFDTLRAGDEVVLEQGGTTWTYRLRTDPAVVPVDAVEVLDRTRGRQLTLTTCWPRYGSSKRMWVRGRLVSVERA